MGPEACLHSLPVPPGTPFSPGNKERLMAWVMLTDCSCVKPRAGPGRKSQTPNPENKQKTGSAYQMEGQPAGQGS
jgi:hypothetical protein